MIASNEALSAACFGLRALGKKTGAASSLVATDTVFYI